MQKQQPRKIERDIIMRILRVELRQGAASFVIATLLAACIGCGEEENTMLFHAGAGQRSSLLDIKKAFEARRPDVSINFSFKGSGFFIADIERSKEGDLYLPGEEFYVLQAFERGFLEPYDPDKDVAAYFMPVIMTPKGNPKNVRKVADFARPGVRVSLANPKSAAIGIWHQKVFKKAGIWEQVRKNQVQSPKCAPEVLTGVQHAVVDATIMWSSTAVLALRDIEIIPLEPEYRGFAKLPVGVVRPPYCKHPKVARELKDFILSDEGKAIFRSHAYVIDPGPLDEDGFCADGGEASAEDCRWIVQAARVCKDESLPVNEQTCGCLIKEVRRQRQTKRAGTLEQQ